MTGRGSLSRPENRQTTLFCLACSHRYVVKTAVVAQADPCAHGPGWSATAVPWNGVAR